MRALTAFALSVCLAGTCHAEAWLTSNHIGTEAFRQSKWAEALAAFEAAWPLAKTPMEQAITANDLGAVLHTLGRPTEAVTWYQRAVALWQTQQGHAEELTESTVGLADSFRSTGDFPASEKTLRSLLPVQGSVNHRAAVLNTLGDLLREQGRKSEARQQFAAALALGEIPPRRQIDAYLGLADIEREAGNRTAAIKEANLVIDLAREANDRASEAIALRIIGRSWLDVNDFARAEPILRRSLSLFQQLPAGPPLQVADSLSCLAGLYRDQGKLSLAEEAWLQSLAIERKYSGDKHPQTALILESLAGIYALQKRFSEAADLASKASGIMTDVLGPESLAAAGALATVGYVAQQEKRFEAAASAYAQALTTLRAKGDPSDRNTLDTMDRYAVVLATLHRNDEAKKLRQEVKAFRFR